MDSLSATSPAPRDLLVWQHALACLRAGVPVTLLLVARSTGGSPGRQGFKMSVAAGSMTGSIGGGIMEHKFVELARDRMKRGETAVLLREQIHRSEAPFDRSGMICSGQQTLLLLPLLPCHIPAVHTAVELLEQHEAGTMHLSHTGELSVHLGRTGRAMNLEITDEAAGRWHYSEALGFRDRLTIVGGGHVALALSRIMATLDFHLTVFDDRPGLNTLLINPYVHEKRSLSYDKLAAEVPEGPNQYAVIMTFGYRSDDVAVRQLLDHDLAYLGLMGSEAKVARLLDGLRTDGYSEQQLHRLYTPIGLPIHSRTPEEIAISVAAEIIRVRNAPFGDAR
ncbi:XdhC family protein [Hymenobacter busanensis]|uniref:XdhC family protein n=1 Tax=Hymenobacter busanensis TaxID=2607656 RepID=A0A7L5A146_9BACT|nr:XdhC/CoxI family protein [Hymenobacter busanensis]KAA9332222.1 XdhC family protein [Hymenobacter busanensis]QHJ07440.1 XdhC/CoxI family protein [Hymenobacter busanensis]